MTGKQLRKRRKALGITQEILELRSGVSQSAISLIERNAVQWPDAAAKLAKVLGVL